MPPPVGSHNANRRSTMCQAPLYAWHEDAHRATTLPGRDYHAQDVFELERERIFFRRLVLRRRGPTRRRSRATSSPSTSPARACWSCAARTASCARSTTSAATAARGSATPSRTGTRRARSSARTTPGATAYDGSLIGTPLVGKDELDRSQLGLWPVTSTSGRASCSSTWRDADRDAARVARAARPTSRSRTSAGSMDELRTGRRTVVRGARRTGRS